MKVYNASEIVKDSLVAEYELRCMAAFAKANLTPTEERFPLFGTRTLDLETKKNYLSKIRAFVEFLLMNGKYDDSLLPFHPRCPRGVIAVGAKAASDFMIYIMSADGAPLATVDGKEIQNARKEQLRGTGRWHNCETLDQFSSALTHIHTNAHQMATSYTEKCDACLAIYKEKGIGGCMHHPVPRYARLGNVSSTTLFKDTVSYLKSKSDHVVKGACHLLPSDVRVLRNWVHANNSVFGMEVFTLLLMSIDLFLRKVEYSSLSGDNFNQELFLMSDKYVAECLNISVKGKKTNRKERKGKADKSASWRKLWLFGDDECTDVDVKRHLLAFLYAIRWRGGYCFPSKDEIDNPPEDGIYKTFIGEGELMATLRAMFEGVLKREDKLASHTGRKTGYLWGRIRGGTLELCMLGADHALVDTAKKYFKDADATADLIRRTPCPEERLGQFHSCYCAPNTEVSARITRKNAHFQCPLHELVVGFMETRVGIDPNHPQARHPTYLLTKILQWNKPQNSMVELRSHLKDVSTDKTSLIMGCVNAINAHTLQVARTEYNKKLEIAVKEGMKTEMVAFQGFLVAKTMSEGELDGPDKKFALTDISSLFEDYLVSKGMPAQKRKADPMHSIVESKKKKEARGEKVLLGRDEFSKLKTPLEKLQHLAKIYTPNTGEFRNRDRQWLLRAKKTLDCYNVCCGKDIATFINMHGKGKATFKLGDVSKCEACS